MLILFVILSTMALMVAWNLLGQSKKTVWEKEGHVWYSQVMSSWLHRRKDLNLFAYSRKNKRAPKALDIAEASGDQQGSRGEADKERENEKTTVVVVYTTKSITVEPKSLNPRGKVEIASWCEPTPDPHTPTIFPSPSKDSTKTYIDTSIPSRMRSLENQADMRLVSSLARAKNELWEKPVSTVVERPAIQHIRGVRRRLD